MNLRHLRVLALLLGAMFLLAQFHLCVEMGRPGASAHACQICTSGAWALASPRFEIGPAVEARPLASVSDVDSGFVAARPPRAPPAV